jgi:glycosyltransferase involved in cell wall biosynthesis
MWQSSFVKGAKISILLPDLRGGGAERVCVTLAHSFLLSGFVPEFVLMQARGDLLPEALSYFSVIDLGCKRALHLPLALARYLHRDRPNALLAAMWPLTVIAPIAQKISGHNCHVVISEHGILSAQYKGRGSMHGLLLSGTTRFGYQLATACIGVSRGVALDMSMLSGVGAPRLAVINNPVPSYAKALPKHIESVNRLWPTPRGSRILTVATLKSVKNHALMLRAFSRLTHSDPSLMIVGQGDQEWALRRLANELGIESRVVFAGFHSDPTPFYATADLFVLSSNYEGFGNVIVEALAQGLPVVSTDCPSGPAEILENGRWGRLVPVGDATALAEAINDALEAEHDRDALKCRAAEFAPEIAARKYLNLLLPA